MRLFAVATGCQSPFACRRRRPGLSHLIEMCQKWKHGAALAALVDQRFRTAQRRARRIQKFQNQLARLLHVNLPIRLLLRPSRARNKQQLRIRPNRLRVPASARAFPSHSFASPAVPPQSAPPALAPRRPQKLHACPHPAAETTAASPGSPPPQSSAGRTTASPPRHPRRPSRR